jgi:peptidoglycan/LPS O-acetylase OafA/YrhL
VLIDVTGWQLQATKVFQYLFNGRAAVSLFFVLSGLVLGMAIRRSRGRFGPEFLSFALRRILRIYPAFAVVLAAIVIVLIFLKVPSSYVAAGPWYQTFFHFYSEPLSAAAVTANAVLIDYKLNPVTWTLLVEIVCSLLLPILHWISIRLAPVQRGGLLMGLVVVAILAPMRASERFWPLMASNGEFLFIFYLGFLHPEFGPGWFGRLRSRHLMSDGCLLAAAGLLLGSKHLYGTAFKTGVVLEGFSAAWIIGALLYGRQLRLYRFLDLPLVRFYGRISYSFYLLHFFVLFLVAQAWFRFIPAEMLTSFPLLFGIALWLLSSALATLPSWLLYHYVETPFIALSKLLCMRFVARKEIALWSEWIRWFTHRSPAKLAGSEPR